ncbi:GNAT family N-acetyltransferase [Mycoplasma simbae]|uniref:GNAT family N-acetyltransferase n=1 Tax=Mycoplasma simbae TaxID=36744 RepID=UPI000495F416|nr:GNAT family N-acetyltransferase [Mycoplasma simbae]
MIQKANLSEVLTIKEFLNLDKDNNFFFIGDIDNFGLHSNIHTTLIKKNNDQIQSVLIIFGTTLLFFDPHKNLTWDEIRSLIIENNLKNINLSDKMFSFWADKFQDSNIYEIHKQYLARLDQKNETVDISEVIKASKEDLESIVKSRLKIAEFSGFSKDFDYELNIYTNSFDSNVLNPFIIKQNDEVISCATVAVDAGEVSIIGGVYTLDTHRKQGLASKVVTALSNWLIERQKTPCLFYHNPKAGSVYRKIGFKEVGNLYTIVVKENANV